MLLYNWSIILPPRSTAAYSQMISHAATLYVILYVSTLGGIDQSVKTIKINFYYATHIYIQAD